MKKKKKRQNWENSDLNSAMEMGINSHWSFESCWILESGLYESEWDTFDCPPAHSTDKITTKEDAGIYFLLAFKNRNFRFPR